MEELGCPWMIVGPYVIAAQEQLRAERLAESQPVNQVPVDLFVFGKGEPPRRDQTKVGGLPYWPARRSWPRSESGAPLAFVAQVNFTDSRDITGYLPGDVLLVFGEPEWVPYRMPLQQPDGSIASGSYEIYTLRLEWLPSGEDDLIRAVDVPPTDWTTEPCYGQIYRTFDCEFGGEDETGQFPGIFNATKIGGIPFRIQEDPRDYFPGQYLCTVAGTRPTRRFPFPFINVSEALTSSPTSAEEEPWLVWYDCGLLYIYLDRTDGQVRHIVDCF